MQSDSTRVGLTRQILTRGPLALVAGLLIASATVISAPTHAQPAIDDETENQPDSDDGPIESTYEYLLWLLSVLFE